MKKSILMALLLLGAVGANASSEKAWQEFRADVEARCIERFRASSYRDSADRKIYVNPFGTQASGVAIINATWSKTKKGLAFLCLYDKKTRKVTDFLELSRFSEQDYWKSF